MASCASHAVYAAAYCGMHTRASSALIVTHPLFMLKTCNCTKLECFNNYCLFTDKTRVLGGRDSWTSGKLHNVLFLHARFSLKGGPCHGDPAWDPSLDLPSSYAALSSEQIWMVLYYIHACTMVIIK